MKLCGCGCGEEVAREGNQFLKRHYSRGMKEKTHSAETIEKMRAAKLGQTHSAESKAKMRAAKLGKKRGPHSEETLEKMRVSHLGKKYPHMVGENNVMKRPEVAARNAATKLGKNHSEERIAKQVKAQTYSLEKWEEKCSLLLKVEELKEEDGKIWGHCTNHNCKNSKELGGWFIPTGYQIAARTDALNDGNDNNCFYCSESCKETCSKFRKSAEQLIKQDEIVAGTYKDSIPLHTSEEYGIWREEVFRRYEEEFGCIECEYCGNRNISELSVHHEKPQKTHPHLALDPDNGIIACNQFSEKKCHYKYGHKTGTECSTGNLANKIC